MARYDLVCILNQILLTEMFQVDIQQDDLERFLIVADRLQVRGLSGEETESDSRWEGQQSV